MSFLLLMGVVAGILLLCFLGIGIGLLLGRRKTLQGCACEFDPDRARSDGSSCGSCEQREPSHPPTRTASPPPTPERTNTP